jgi:hypothetical protein
MEDSTIFVAKNFVKILSLAGNDADQEEIFTELVLESVKHLKIMCTKGSSFQNLIINTKSMLQSLKEILSNQFLNVSRDIELKCFQLVANLCVKNESTLEKIHQSMFNVIMAKFEGDDNSFLNVSAMIIYNLILNKSSSLDQKHVVQMCAQHYSNVLKNPTNSLPDFVHILLEFFICKSENVVEIFEKLEPDEQKIFLYYVHDHVEVETNE